MQDIFVNHTLLILVYYHRSNNICCIVLLCSHNVMNISETTTTLETLTFMSISTTPDPHPCSSPDCYSSSNTYTGRANCTETGRICQRWDTNHPHHVVIDANNLPAHTLSDGYNYCRDPDSSGFPWCFTTDPRKRWERCDVPQCTGMLANLT
jgi:hypothetical protein